MKSAMAEPSRRNSGLETTAKSIGSGWSARTMSATQSPVPTGTVLLLTMTSGCLHVPATLSAASLHVLQVGLAVHALGRADGDEDELGVVQRLGVVGRESETPGRSRCAAPSPPAPARRWARRPRCSVSILCFVHVQAADLVAQVGEAGAGHEAHVAGADYSDIVHNSPSSDRLDGLPNAFLDSFCCPQHRGLTASALTATARQQRTSHRSYVCRSGSRKPHYTTILPPRQLASDWGFAN